MGNCALLELCAYTTDLSLHNLRQCHNTNFSPSTCSSFLPTESFRQLSTWPATVRTEATEKEECFHLAIDSFPFYREYKNLYSLLYAWQKERRAVIRTHRRVSIRELSHLRAAVSWRNYTRLRKKKGRGQRKELHQNLKGEKMEKKPYLVKGDQKAQGCLNLEVRPAKNYTGGERKNKNPLLHWPAIKPNWPAKWEHRSSPPPTYHKKCKSTWTIIPQYYPQSTSSPWLDFS